MQEQGGCTCRATPSLNISAKRSAGSLTSALFKEEQLLSLGRTLEQHYIKRQLTIGAGGVFFIRFIRVKTSDEQTLSLFPDEDFMTCPLLALALALITQESPYAALLNKLSVQSKDVPVELTDSIPLLDKLEDSGTLDFSQMSKRSTAVHTTPTVGVHALVNRLLNRVVGPAGVEEPLTSHSFRRSMRTQTRAQS
uniref:Uncharacterized protein n=1 Tax=Phytophthora ramorum TaxID=164328 RepID=H3GU54_PHYRM